MFDYVRDFNEWLFAQAPTNSLTVLATHTVYAHDANQSCQECLTWLLPNSASDSVSNSACAARAAPDKAPGFRDRYASSGAASR